MVHRNASANRCAALVAICALWFFFSLPPAQAQADRPLRWERSNGLNGGRIDCFAELGGTVFAGGGGLYSSTDSGRTWRLIPNVLTCRDLLVNGSVVYASGGRALHRSTDSGRTWRQIFSAQSSITSLAANGSTLFLGTEFHGVFRSTDNGTTWTVSNMGIPTPTSTSATYFIQALYVHRGVIFAGADNGGGIFLSTDNGLTWSDVSRGLRDRLGRSIRSIQAIGLQLFAAGQGGAYSSDDNGITWNIMNIGMTETDITSMTASPTELFAGSARGQIYRTPGGRWTPINNETIPINTVIQGMSVLSGIVWAGASAGIFLSADNGATWSPRNSGLPALEVRAILLNDATLFVGTPGSGVFRSTDNGSTWTPSSVGITELRIFAMAANGTTLFAGTYGEGIARSTTNGVRWETIRNGLGGGVYIFALLVSGNTIYAGTLKNGIYRSTDNGTTWRAANGGIPTQTTVNAFVQVGSAILAGTERGVYRSTDNGTNWTAVNPGVQAGTFPQNVFALYTNGKAIFAGDVSGRGVFRSLDFGTTWTQANVGLPSALSVQSFVEYAGGLYIGTTRGVYRTANNGDSWLAVNDGFSSTPSVFTLAVCGTGLFAGTFGGPGGSGVYRALPPTVSTFSPAFAPAGASVKLFGTNLTSVSGVSIGGVRVERFTVDSPTEITATVPMPASPMSAQVLARGKVVVSAGGGTSASEEDFAILPVRQASSSQLVAIDPIDFGRVTLRDGGAMRLVKVYNVSGTTIKLKPAVLTNSDDFSFAIAENVTTDFTLLNQDFAVVAVRFNPLTAAAKSATLSITASIDGGQSITTTARITGRGAPLKVFPLDFGTSVTGKGLAVPALVANYGTRTARLTAQRFQAGNQGMSVARGQTVFLSPGDTTAVLLSALQLAEGQYFDTLRVESDIDTAFAPVQLVTRKGDTTDIIVQMGLRAVPDSAAPGSPVTLELFIRGEENLNVLRQRNAPFSGSIRYDRRVLYIQPNQSRTEIARNSETQNTFQRAKILLTPWDGRETTLMKIPAIAMLSEIDSTELVVENIAWNDPSGTNNVFVTAPQNGRFKVALRRVGGNRLLRQVDKTLLVTEIAPNPANDAVQTAFTLKQSGTVTLALYNALGNMVLSRAGEEFEAGNHTVKFSTANLPNGVYALRLTSQEGSDQTTVVINR